MPSAELWIDLKIVLQSEVSQKERKRYYVVSLVCGSTNMIQMNLFAKQKQSHRCGKQTYGYQVGKGGWDELGDWDRHIYTTMYNTDNDMRTSYI